MLIKVEVTPRLVTGRRFSRLQGVKDASEPPLVSIAADGSRFLAFGGDALRVLASSGRDQVCANPFSDIETTMRDCRLAIAFMKWFFGERLTKGSLSPFPPQVVAQFTGYARPFNEGERIVLKEILMHAGAAEVLLGQLEHSLSDLEAKQAFGLLRKSGVPDKKVVMPTTRVEKWG